MANGSPLDEPTGADPRSFQTRSAQNPPFEPELEHRDASIASTHNSDGIAESMPEHGPQWRKHGRGARNVMPGLRISTVRRCPIIKDGRHGVRPSLPG